MNNYKKELQSIENTSLKDNASIAYRRIYVKGLIKNIWGVWGETFSFL